MNTKKVKTERVTKKSAHKHVHTGTVANKNSNNNNNSGVAKKSGLASNTKKKNQKKKAALKGPIPVTVLSGFLGSGKTTLLKNILENRGNFRVALIVNDMAELNIDSKLIKEGNFLNQVEEKMVEMQNGCICCTLREDLLVEIRKLGQAGKYDYIVIESTGISEPMQVAETFTFEDFETGQSLSKWARLDTMVTVVDAFHFFDYVDSEKNVQDTKEALDPEDTRNISQLLIEQVEFANLVLINKCDLVDEKHLGRVEQAVRSLNPKAQVTRTTHSKIPIDQVLNTKRFTFEEASQNSGWLQVMRGSPLVPESEEYGISSFVFRARKPFHDERLDALVDQSTPLPGVIRSKGSAWIAGQHDMLVEWTSTGRIYSLEPDGPWVAAESEEEIEQMKEALKKMDRGYDFEKMKNEVWQEPYGDRRQEIVIIGLNLDVASITDKLNHCLLTDEEMKEGPEHWAKKWQDDGPWAYFAEYFEQEEDEEEGVSDEDESASE